MVERWLQGWGLRLCYPLTRDQRAKTAAAQPGIHRRDRAPPGHARREQRAGRRPQLSGGARLPLLPGSVWVGCPPPGSRSSRGSGRVPESPGEALVGRQRALRVAGEGDLGPNPEPPAPPHPLHRLLPGVPEQ